MEPQTPRLTLEILKALPDEQAFATGTALNNPEGLFMEGADYLRDKPLIWIAVKGAANDWTIYTHWESNGYDFTLSNGDKVTSEFNIRKLVDCDDEAFARYRY